MFSNKKKALTVYLQKCFFFNSTKKPFYIAPGGPVHSMRLLCCDIINEQLCSTNNKK